MIRHPLAATALAILLLPAPGARAGDGETPPDGAGATAPAKAAEAPPADGTAAGAAREGKAPPPAPPPAPPRDRKAAKPDPANPVAVRRSPRSKAEALRILDQIAVSVKFEDLALRDAIDYLAAVTGMNIIVGPALAKEGGADALRVDLRLTKVSARQVLELLASSRGLGVGFQGSVLTVTTLKEARGKPVLRLYPIGDMTMPLRDFPAPDLILRPAGAERTEEVPTETKNPFGDADEILRMMKENTGEGTWEDEGVSASATGDWIVVKQYEEVHAEIGRLLRLLRSAR